LKKILFRVVRGYTQKFTKALTIVCKGDHTKEMNDNIYARNTWEHRIRHEINIEQKSIECSNCAEHGGAEKKSVFLTVTSLDLVSATNISHHSTAQLVLL
jgi:hypothetical protein